MTVLFISGSTRKNSYNTKLVKFAYNYSLKIALNSKIVNLNDFEIPIYNGDYENENGIPQDVKKLKQLFINCKALFISTPEYNGFFSPLLKNTLDWLSRPEPGDEVSLSAFKNKFASISAASIGKFGGIRALPYLRLLLNNLGLTVSHHDIAIPFADKNFNQKGELKDENLKNVVFKSINHLKVLIND